MDNPSTRSKQNLGKEIDSQDFESRVIPIFGKYGPKMAIGGGGVFV